MLPCGVIALLLTRLRIVRQLVPNQTAARSDCVAMRLGRFPLVPNETLPKCGGISSTRGAFALRFGSFPVVWREPAP